MTEIEQAAFAPLIWARGVQMETARQTCYQDFAPDRGIMGLSRFKTHFHFGAFKDRRASVGFHRCSATAQTPPTRV